MGSSEQVTKGDRKKQRKKLRYAQATICSSVNITSLQFSFHSIRFLNKQWCFCQKVVKCLNKQQAQSFLKQILDENVSFIMFYDVQHLLNSSNGTFYTCSYLTWLKLKMKSSAGIQTSFESITMKAPNSRLFWIRTINSFDQKCLPAWKGPVKSKK